MIDELTLLREARPETQAADTAVVLRARRAVLRRALGPRTRRRYAVRGVIGVAAASITLLSLGVVDLPAENHPANSAAAANVLHRAAAVTLRQSDPHTKPGQWLRWTQTEQDWVAMRGSDGSILTGSDGKPEVFQTQRIRTIWIPHNVMDPWIDRDTTIAGQNISRDTAPFNQSDPTQTIKKSSWADPNQPRNYAPEFDPAWYASLPRDPQKLLAKIMAEAPGGAGKSMNWYFQEIFSPVLISPVAPADIRAALFQALAATPGIDVAQGLTNLDGRAAVAIGYGTTGHQWLFDQTSGQFIGERETSPDFPSVPGLDQAKTTSLTSVEVRIVDDSPAADNSH